MSQRPPGQDERNTIAPPPASIPASSRHLVFADAPVVAAEANVPAQAPPRRAPWLAATVVALTVLLAIADSILGLRGWVSLLPTTGFSLLAIPWIVLVLRPERGPSAPARGRLGIRVFEGLFVALLLAVLGAKWLACVRGLTEGASYAQSYRIYTGLLVALLIGGVLLRAGRMARVVAAGADHPARLMMISFAGTALLGALLLALPMSLRRLTDVSLLDSLFLSMSAVCVTGLSTVNVANTYTFEGQVILVALVQVGGLGIMALTAAVTMLAGRRLDVKSSSALAEIVDAESLANLGRTIFMIIAYTLVLEAIGASLLFAQFRMLPASDFAFDSGSGIAGAESALWAAIFHSVSGFCNAGLSNFRDGMVPFSTSLGSCQTMACLIVLGGLGFPVIHELLLRAITKLRRRRPPRLSLNSRLGLITTALLLAGMTLAYLALESSASLKHLGWVDRLNAALFQSVSARTAGFNVVDVSLMLPATLLLTCFAMFVGGDPGGTAGGIKTTTLAVLFSAYRAELRGRRAQLFDRAIPDAVVRRAMGVAFLSVAIVVSVVFVLLLTERHPPLALVFEAVSAFSTTGLSTGITPELSGLGKMLLIGTMLVGRVGPLTMAIALSARARVPVYELPQERVMIG